METKRLQSNQPSGFTLLEVMIAVAIIAMALVAAIGSQSQSVSLATEAKFTTTAIFLAQGKMAELEAQNPDDLVSDAGDFGEDFPGYRWESEVNPATATLDTLGEASRHLKKIVLTVGRGDNDRYQYRLEYYRFVPQKD
jgi:general secretion pathway protein I